MLIALVNKQLLLHKNGSGLDLRARAAVLNLHFKGAKLVKYFLLLVARVLEHITTTKVLFRPLIHLRVTASVLESKIWIAVAMKRFHSLNAWSN